MKYMEITQDGAGFIPTTEASKIGLYTTGVASCAVYAIWGSQGILMIHDTAQLEIHDMFTLAKKVGEVKKLVFAVNENLENHSRITHDEKIEKIINITKPQIIEKIDLPLGLLSINHHGYEITQQKNEIFSSPSKEKRHEIMVFNNLFIPINSQSVKVDFQFDGEKFTNLPKLQRSIEEMKIIANKKYSEGDPDYKNWLEARQDYLT